METMLMFSLLASKKTIPSQLGRLHSPPSQLYVESNNWEELSNLPMLAVVGTRKPTAYGSSSCAQIVRALAAQGVCIVSGLALGMDSVAHRAALEAGGRTIAVLPAGLQTIYPASHRGLASDIITQGGALISEYPPHMTAALNHNFIQRNRIIAGLSKAVFIPEAAAKSGSLHTAQFAIDAGIDVCALPGQITNPLSEGCHNLIKSGAGLVTSADDILALLGITGNSTHKNMVVNARSPAEAIILELISNGIHDADDLQTSSNLPIEQFNQALTMLEITGKIVANGNNNWTLS